MFKRAHHQRIARVLDALNADLLLKHGCLFGGGTAISLANNEFRESVDMDFIVSSKEGYRDLRSAVHAGGLQALTTMPLALKREAKIDQYGIRCAIESDDSAPIKLEIVYEGRVQLAPPLATDKIGRIWTLSEEDRVATKLMANSDRWADDSVLSRDLIDLSFLAQSGALDSNGVEKAVGAYGMSVINDFDKSKNKLLEREGWLKNCMRRMDITIDEAVMREQILAMTIEWPPAPSPGSQPAHR